jgi:hypothetical protein
MMMLGSFLSSRPTGSLGGRPLRRASDRALGLTVLSRSMA